MINKLIIFLCVFIPCGIEFFLIVKQNKYYLHMIQLCSYNLDQTMQWYVKHFFGYLINIFFIILNLFLINEVKIAFIEPHFLSFRSYHYFIVLILAFVLIILTIILFVATVLRKSKKKFVVTDRIKRNIVVLVILNILSVILINIFLMKVKNIDNMYGVSIFGKIIFKIGYQIVMLGILIGLAPFLTLISFFIMRPIEKNNSKKFIDMASKKLNGIDNIEVIGITGSFGKTSVKNFLYDLLVTKYNVCKTPESFNTPLGITRTINNNLKNYDEKFICEMGARRVGDIKEICDIVNPTSCIITEVGNMHLDTFKNIENVMKTKMELLESVVKNIENDNRKNNVIILNGDNEKIREYVKNKNYNDEIKKHIYYVGENEHNDFYISEIKGSKDGSSFIFNINCMDRLDNEDGKIEKQFELTTKLIGKNNIKDIALSVAIAILKNINIDDIIYEVKKISQVKNRLEVMNVDENNIIINDAYNSNPIGAKEAVNAINTFIGYIKIIITPGMVELGDKQYEENNNFGKYAGENCDYVLVVSSVNKNAIIDGAKEGMKEKENIEEKILYFDEVEKAIIYARNNIEGKKVILLENDLSDNY